MTQKRVARVLKRIRINSHLEGLIVHSSILADAEAVVLSKVLRGSTVRGLQNNYCGYIGTTQKPTDFHKKLADIYRDGSYKELPTYAFGSGVSYSNGELALDIDYYYAYIGFSIDGLGPHLKRITSLPEKKLVRRLTPEVARMGKDFKNLANQFGEEKILDFWKTVALQSQSR